jgi:SAM-dependent methyltransferase
MKIKFLKKIIIIKRKFAHKILSSEQYDTNTKAYDGKYERGYALNYPDGHVIRINEHVLKYELGLKGGKILDFGCGVGQHLEYFAKNGYTPYGCDVVERSIKQCKAIMPEFSENFHVNESIPNLKDHFNEEFDLIFSNQTLYYLNDKDINNLLSQFDNMLKPGGVFVATMISPKNYMNNPILPSTVERFEGGLTKCSLRGRVNDTTYVNFKTKEEMVKLFDRFKKIQVGWYSQITREQEGQTDHFIFIGQKK